MRNIADDFAMWFMLLPIDGAIGLGLVKGRNAFFDVIGPNLDERVITFWFEQ